MAKLLSELFLLLMVCSAYAQSSGAEAPVEKASGLTVVIFLLVFIGSCVAYFAYIWWNAWKKRKPEKGERSR
jgi:hypothetical protein